MKKIISAFNKEQETSMDQHGQAAAEAALAMIVLLLLLSGVIDLGRAFFTYIAVHNAVAEGAYYGAAFPQRFYDYSTVASQDPNNIQFRTLNEVPPALNQLINWEEADLDIRYSIPNPRPGDQIIVTADVPFRMIGPLPGLLGWSGGFTIRARAVQTIIAEPFSP